MLATLAPKPFDKPGWVYEEKYDGVRILAYKEEGRVRLLSRNEKRPNGKLPSNCSRNPDSSTRHSASRW